MLRVARSYGSGAAVRIGRVQRSWIIMQIVLVVVVVIGMVIAATKLWL